MKVLIAYDGSNCANSALEDLKQAGLLINTEVSVLTVTENWTLILEEQQKDLAAEEDYNYQEPETLKRMHETAQAAFAEAQELVKNAAARLQKDFPSWSVQQEVALGSVSSGILSKAHEWKPDLIVVGSHGRNLVGRVVLGSVSLRILSEADCSVRVARSSPARTSDDCSPQRVIIGIDGSPDSMLALGAVAKRVWRQKSAVRLVSVIEPLASPWLGDEIQQAEEICQHASHQLTAAGLQVSTTVRVGDAKQILVKEAEKWDADAIFVGARGHRLLERILLGSVSYAVAARAHCSVEVIR